MGGLLELRIVEKLEVWLDDLATRPLVAACSDSRCRRTALGRVERRGFVRDAAPAPRPRAPS
jgi:hypothetical protein